MKENETEFNERLVKMIREYWYGQDCLVKVWSESHSSDTTHQSRLVRSNMINGYPFDHPKRGNSLRMHGVL